MKRSRCVSDKNRQFDVVWFLWRRTRKNSVLSVEDNESMLATNEHTASVGAADAFIAITGVLKKFLHIFNDPYVILDSALCPPDVELANVVFQGETWFILVARLYEYGWDILNKTFFFCDLSRNVAWYTGQWTVSFIFRPDFMECSAL